MNTIDKEKRTAVDNSHCCYKTAIAETHQAQRFLNRLCKHFSHKVDVKWENHLGFIKFSMGVCYLEARDTNLHFRCEANNKTDLSEIIDTIDSHFKRFSGDEGTAMSWHI